MAPATIGAIKGALGSRKNKGDTLDGGLEDAMGAMASPIEQYENLENNLRESDAATADEHAIVNADSDSSENSKGERR